MTTVSARHRLFFVVTAVLLAWVSVVASPLAAPAHAAASYGTTTPAVHGPAGGRVTATGANWAPGDQMQVAWIDSGAVLATTTIDGSGRFSAPITIPSSAASGAHQIRYFDVQARYFEVSTFTVDPPVTVGNAYVANAAWAATTRVVIGDLVRYQIALKAGGNATVNVRMKVTGPGGRTILDGAGDVGITTSTGSVYFQGTIPYDAPVGTYTQTATVTYDGVVTVRTSAFSVDLAPRVKNAIAWAKAQLGRHDWDGLCERFVELAYGTSGKFDPAQKAFVKLHTSTSRSPAVGALVWFAPNAGNLNAGHVGIYLGNDQFISATTGGVVTRTITAWSNGVAPYEGWGAAPADWPGR